MPNVAFVIEYDGTQFYGWQRQPGMRTIQEEFEKALAMVLRIPLCHVQASGRTDSGVHARAQVVNVHLPEAVDLEPLAHSISCILCGEVSILHGTVVPEDFNACFSAIAKEYRYSILNRNSPPALLKGKVWHRWEDFNLSLMQSEAKLLEGVNDFTSMRGHGCGAKSAVREVFQSEVTKAGDLITYRVAGAGFLKQMVRNIAGTLVSRGSGRLLTSMQEILDAKDRRCAGMTAPAYGLSLEWVSYGRELDSLLGVSVPEWVYE